MKILRTCHAGVAGVFFPIGSPKEGGTCEYATKECTTYCYAKEKDYDETLNIPEEDKREIHQFFIGNPSVTVCVEVLKEMEELQATVLSWFASGDCLDVDVDKIYKMMMLLQEEGVIQNGFTRNKELWQKLADSKNLNYDILRIVLTVEDLDEGGVTPYCGKGAPNAVWAVPDYDEGVVSLYHGRLGYTSYGGCGSGNTYHKFKGHEVEIASNCLACFKRKIGCFFQPSEKDEKTNKEVK